MHGFDYNQTEFSFQTVFHFDNAFSYCICSCGFEHECLDYITESGTIDEEKYDKIVKCIIDGECPHVCQVPVRYVKEATIHAMDIAVGIGTREAVYDSLTRRPVRRRNLYHLNVFSAALLNKSKDDTMIFDLMKRYDESNKGKLIHAERCDNDPDVVSFQAEEVCEFLARKNINLLKCCFRRIVVPNRRIRDEDRFRLTLRCNLEVEEGFVMDGSASDYFETFRTVRVEQYLQRLSSFCIWAIFYDKPKVLDTVLFSFKLISLGKYYTALIIRLNYMCQLFPRRECEKILKMHRCSMEAAAISLKDKVIILLDLLLERPSVMRVTVIQALKQIPDVHKIVDTALKDGKNWNHLHAYNQIFSDKNDPEVLRIILDSGIDLNAVDSNGKTPLVHLIERHIHVIPSIDEVSKLQAMHQTAEMYIFENPDIEKNQAAVAKAIEADEQLNKLQPGHLISDFHLTGEYQMDVQLHCIFGYDDSDSFVLNFLAPLLLESGFILTQEVCCELFEHKILHPKEMEYIKEYMSFPRSLKVCCRESLRRHFKGRQIHKFVDQSDIPQSVKDYILLRPLLRCQLRKNELPVHSQQRKMTGSRKCTVS